MALAIFEQAASLLLDAEAVYHALVCRWTRSTCSTAAWAFAGATFREGKEWAGERTRYVHVSLPAIREADNKPGRIRCRTAALRRLLKKVYVPTHFGDYLRVKYGTAALVAAIPDVPSSRLNVTLNISLKGD